MIAIIFEVEPDPAQKDGYLKIAARLREDLETISGFISVERFESITQPGKMLSLSFFETEEAVTQWRNLASHRMAQKAGREGMFTGYRLRVASVMRDYGLHERDQAPSDSLEVHS